MVRRRPKLIVKAYETELFFEPLGDKDVLSVMVNGLNSLLDYHWWLSAGTLLGLYRDGGFIPHDSDIDIGVLGNIDRDNFPDFDLVRTVDDGDRQMQSVYLSKDSKVLFDILHYWDYKDYQVINISEEGCLTRPKSMVMELGLLEHKDWGFFVPGRVEEYLEMWYGKDWKTPKRGGKTQWETLKD